MYSKNDLSKCESLMYDILFTRESKFEINLVEYLENPYRFKIFTKTILGWLEDAGVNVIEQELFFLKKKMFWVITIKR